MSELISPELALVDPELAAAARAVLPDRPSVLERRSRAEAPARPAALALEAPVAPVSRPLHKAVPATTARPRVARLRLALLVPAVAALVVLCGIAVEHQLGDASNPFSSHPGSTAASVSTIAIDPVPVRATNFTWPSLASARSYRLDIRHEGALVYTVDTRATKAVLPKSAQLRRGTYSWRVVPLLGTRDAPRVGAPLVEGTFATQ